MMIVLPIPPSANRYWRMWQGRMVKSTEARTYQAEAGWKAKAVMPEVLSGPVALTLRVFRQQRRGDLDNRIKVILDALQGVVYLNDSQVTELHVYQDDDKANPRVEVHVETL